MKGNEACVLVGEGDGVLFSVDLQSSDSCEEESDGELEEHGCDLRGGCVRLTEAGVASLVCCR